MTKNRKNEMHRALHRKIVRNMNEKKRRAKRQSRGEIVVAGAGARLVAQPRVRIDTAVWADYQAKQMGLGD